MVVLKHLNLNITEVYPRIAKISSEIIDGEKNCAEKNRLTAGAAVVLTIPSRIDGGILVF